jgi:hypothetical protein
MRLAKAALSYFTKFSLVSAFAEIPEIGDAFYS